MKTSDLGKRTSFTPAYGLTEEKKAKQGYETFTDKSKDYKDSQDLMGGPKPLSLLNPSEKANYAKEKLARIMMDSFGRFHDV